MAAEDDHETLSLQTLAGLEQRLAQIEFYVLGGPDYEEEEERYKTKPTPGNTPTERLRRAEQRLAALTAKNRVVADVLGLHKKLPELFPEDLVEKPADAYTTEEKYDIVNSCATMYPSTASRLTSIKDTPVPPTETFSMLSGLGPQLAQVELQQQDRLDEIAELRLKTTIMFQRWADLSVIAANECWAEWQARLLEAEKIVRRHEAAKKAEKEPV